MIRSPKNYSLIIRNSGLVLLVSIIAACGSGHNGKSTQVAAKVNDAEISLHQINQVMQTAKNVTAENAPQIRKQILEKLIDQEILVEKATQDNLDRTPEVMLAIESAKKEILARAYVSKLVSSSIKVSEQDIKKYYDEHTGLFSKRKIYSFQDVGMAKDDQLFTELQDLVAKSKSMQEIVELLKSKNVKMSAGAYNKPAEQIPLEILPKMQDLVDGQTVVLNVENSMHVIHILKTTDAPVDLQAATPLIRNYFMNTKGKEFLVDEMKRMRQQSKIEYVGDFKSEDSVGVQETVKQEKPTDSNTKSGLSADIEKGVAGLK